VARKVAHGFVAARRGDGLGRNERVVDIDTVKGDKHDTQHEQILHGSDQNTEQRIEDAETGKVKDFAQEACCYFYRISCSKLRKIGALKKSKIVISNPSHTFFRVETVTL